MFLPAEIGLLRAYEYMFSAYVYMLDAMPQNSSSLPKTPKMRAKVVGEVCGGEAIILITH